MEKSYSWWCDIWRSKQSIPLGDIFGYDAVNNKSLNFVTPKIELEPHENIYLKKKGILFNEIY